jgi:hypothetical protein
VIRSDDDGDGRRSSTMPEFRALQGSRHHARHACRGIRVGLVPDPLAVARATVRTAGSRLKRHRPLRGRSAVRPAGSGSPGTHFLAKHGDRGPTSLFRPVFATLPVVRGRPLGDSGDRRCRLLRRKLRPRLLWSKDGFAASAAGRGTRRRPPRIRIRRSSGTCWPRGRRCCRGSTSARRLPARRCRSRAPEEQTS